MRESNMNSSIPFPAPASERATAAVIALCDWLDRLFDGNPINPERAAAVTMEKCNALLTTLGLERISRTGLFEPGEQEIVDTVATTDQTEDFRVCESVRCGYRTREGVLRPQQVLVFRYRLPDPP
jgi:molecular chaperone GrpE (heat shock protein)